LERLTGLLSVAHISRVEKLMVRRPPQIIAGRSESREIDPPAGFVRSQTARISQAIIVAHTMTMEGKFQAIDRCTSSLASSTALTASCRPNLPRRRRGHS
jgi:hypothetical protein